MKIEYICHACLSIDTGDLRIVTDPWFHGPAYCGQWNVFPKPVSTSSLSDAQFILLSHGHEDHFHCPSLTLLPKSARVLYPYGWYGGVKNVLADLGFQETVEAPTHKTISLSPETSVTYIVNNLDSIIVVESHGQVLVNVNDALHCYPSRIVAKFIEYIRGRWPRIDTVFCGFGGASYFPNTVHCPGKSDKEIGEAREQTFAHAFCRIVHDLKPAVAVPFAADFVLLRKHQRWINQIRFPRLRLQDYYREIYGHSPGDSRIQVMYPGDALVDNEVQSSSPYRSECPSGSFVALIEEQYAVEIAELEKESWLTATKAESLEKQLVEHVQIRSEIFEPEILEKIAFTVRVPDIHENPYFNISNRSGKLVVSRSAARSPESILEIEVPSRILEYSLASDWGGDAVTIGYGCEIQVFEQDTVSQGLDTVCVQLLTRIPAASRHWRSEPLRMTRYVLASPMNRSWAARAAWNRVLGKPAATNDPNDKMREWLFRTKCEVCRACDLPLLDEKFAETL